LFPYQLLSLEHPEALGYCRRSKSQAVTVKRSGGVTKMANNDLQ